MSVQHSALTGTELHQPFYKGNDSAKPASPAVGDWFYATDTDVLYKCKSIGVWSQQKGGITSGLESAKPATATVGDFYFSTDKNILWNCLSTNAWTIFNARKAGTFVNGDLSTGVLTVTHGWALSAPYVVSVVVFDNNNQQIIPDVVTGLTNSVTIDLTSFSTLSGTWGYLIKA